MKHNQEFAFLPPTAKRPKREVSCTGEMEVEEADAAAAETRTVRRIDWCMPYFTPTLLDAFRLCLARVGRDLAPGSVIEGCTCRFLAVVLRKRTAGRSLAFADTDFVPLWSLKNMPFIIPPSSTLRNSMSVVSTKKPSQKQQQVAPINLSKRAQKRANAQQKSQSSTSKQVQASSSSAEEVPVNIPNILKVQVMFERSRWDRYVATSISPPEQQRHHQWSTVSLCEAGSLIYCTGRIGRSSAGAPTILAEYAELLRVSPNPESVARVMTAYMSGSLSPAQASRALSCTSSPSVLDRLSRIMTSKKAGIRHKALAQCARRLRGCASLQRNRTRRPRVSERDLSILKSAEERPECAKWRPNLPTLGGSASELRSRNEEEARAIAAYEAELQGAGIDPLKNIPKDADWRRFRYALAKKSPQANWMTARILYVLEKSCTAMGRERTVVDVGGGRGDLALVVAAALGERGHVTVVDTNLESLAAGEQRAAAEGLLPHMTFIGDRIENVKDFNFSLVIGLHACGGLGEYALRLAAVHGASFVLCTCCFNSNPGMAVLTRVCDDPPLPLNEVKTLCGLAEKVTDPPTISRRAMHAMNAMRLGQIYKIFNEHNPDKSLDLFQAMYPEKYSRANCVLIGIVTPKNK